MKTANRQIAKRHGTAGVELAIALPLIGLLFGAVIEFAFMMWAKNHMVWVAREAVRERAVRGTDLSKLRADIAKNLSVGGLQASETPVVKEEPGSNSSVYVVVTIKCDYNPKLLRVVLGGTQKWEVSTKMRKESKGT